MGEISASIKSWEFWHLERESPPTAVCLVIKWEGPLGGKYKESPQRGRVRGSDESEIVRYEEDSPRGRVRYEQGSLRGGGSAGYEGGPLRGSVRYEEGPLRGTLRYEEGPLRGRGMNEEGPLRSRGMYEEGPLGGCGK